MPTRDELVLMFMLALATSKGLTVPPAKIREEAELLATEYLNNI